ncbi:hypothetical protein L7F22_011286 [Adiantum nelumboides]|nr:hypothetical protein [Adiantum nelumboides]
MGELSIAKHVEYIKSLDKKKDFEAVLTEHLRMSGAYWGLTSMDLMGHLAEMDKEAIISWLLRCQHESGKVDKIFEADKGGSLPPDLHAFSYSDWAGCFDTRVSTSGFCFMLGSSCISWLSKKQPTVATSSCEAEYRAFFRATVECVWLRRLMADLGVGEDTANTIYADSQSALAVARNPVFHARTKHIEVHYHYVRERLSAGEMSLAYVPTQDNLVDLFTKALSREKLEAFRKALGLLPFVD